MNNLVDVICELLGPPLVLSEVVLLIILVSCVVFCGFFVFLLLLVLALCVLCPMLPLILDFPLLIAASGFSNVYL